MKEVKEQRFDKYLIGSVLEIILGILRIISLICAVLFAGLTIGFFVIIAVKGADISSDIVVPIMQLLGNYSEVEALDLIAVNGLGNVMIAGIMYGGITTISSTIMFAVVSRAQEVFKNIVAGKTYVKKNITLVNETIPLSMIYIFFQPILLFVVSSVTGVYDVSYLNYYGIALVLIACVIKYILEQGYDELKDAKKNERIVDDYLAKNEENELQILNKENKITQLKDENKLLKDQIKELEAAKVIKKPEVKTQVKQEAKTNTKEESKTATKQQVKNNNKPNKKAFYKKPVKKNVKKATK